MPHRPIFGFEPIGRIDRELAFYLNERPIAQFPGGEVKRVIVPDSQDKTGCEIPQQNFDIRFLVPRLPLDGSIDLSTDSGAALFRSGSLLQFFYR